jgi:hypothetical protein
MQINRVDNGMNIRTILFLVLFFILVLSSSAIQGNNYKSSLRYSAETELLSGAFSQNHCAILCNTLSLPDLFKFYECATHNTRLVPFSVTYKIIDSDRKINQNYILIQKTMLSIESVLRWRIYFNHPSNEDDIPPVLS